MRKGIAVLITCLALVCSALSIASSGTRYVGVFWSEVYATATEGTSDPSTNDLLENPCQSYGFFALLADDYGGTQTHFHCGIDVRRVSPEEFRRIYYILFDYALSADLEVGVEYPVTPELLEKLRSQLDERDSGPFTLRGHFDQPDRQDTDDDHYGSAADSYSFSKGLGHGYGWADIYSEDPIPDYNNAWAHSYMYEDDWQVPVSWYYLVTIYRYLDAFSWHCKDSYSEYYWQWRVTDVAGTSGRYEYCNITNGYFGSSVVCWLNSGTNYDAAYINAVNARASAGNPVDAFAEMETTWDYMEVVPYI